MRISQLFSDPDIQSLIHEKEEEAKEKISKLTPQQLVILRHIIDGKQNKLIAYELGISQRTVENHRLSITDRLGVKSTTDMTRLVILGS